MQDYAAARYNMVEGQLKPNKVNDFAVLNAMANVPRELFVPEHARGVAYVDDDIRIGNGRHLVEPMVFARLINEARVDRDDMVLDIGCGTGYSTAVLARLAGSVVAVESDPALAAHATDALLRLGIDNAVVATAPMTEGYPLQAPYQVIVINGSVAAVPGPIMRQLADGGRLVTVCLSERGVGRGMLYRRLGDVTSGIALFDAATPFLPGFEPRPVFEF